MSLKLYELSDSINLVSQMIEDGEEGLEEILETLDMTFQQKVEGIVKLMKSKMAEHEAIETESKRLKERANKIAKEIDWIFNYVETEMKRTNTLEVKSALFKIKLGANPPRVEVTNQALLPEQYLRTTLTVSPDKMAIKEELQKGKSIPGAELRQDMKLKIK